MPDRELIKETLLFLRHAREEWAKIAEEAQASGKTEAAQRARSQEVHCQAEIARLLADLPAEDWPF